MDIRVEAVQYYDLQPSPFDDIPFYQSRVPSKDASVLELGCGTGRVLLPLTDYCGYIHGLDISEAMLSICRQKLQRANIPKDKASVEVADITNFSLDRTFDFIIAPFRVLQNLETDDQVNGLFDCIGAHLSRDGSCILNVFHPNRDADGLRKNWCTMEEKFSWEKSVGKVQITCHDRRPRMESEKLVLYPELIYRTYQENALQRETVLKIVMRCYYPQQFEQLIVDHGFKILNRWGGYADEPYGDGPELVVEFGHRG
ncbi:MAG: class I SAM-dependent methyltransferase [Candidatus Poribacteria bacterium]|nr:class I SAM-dependent methyltransferase [Candidatus Poribacteria bacterium]